MNHHPVPAGDRRRCPSPPASSVFTATFGIGLLIAALGTSAPAARAQVANGTVVQNFDTTSTATVFRVGDASFQAAGGPDTLGGNGTGQTAFLTTLSLGGDGFNVSGADAVVASTLARALALNPASLVNGASAATEGSGLTFGTFLNAGQTLAFDFSFFTAEPTGAGSGGNLDFAFVTLAPGDAAGGITGASIYRFLLDTRADTFSTINDPLGLSPFSFALSGTQAAVLPTVATAGNYVIGFGVVDANAFDTQSGLAIDNITVVPEPGTLSLLTGGTLILGVALRRRRQRATAKWD